MYNGATLIGLNGISVKVMVMQILLPLVMHETVP